MAPLRNRSRRRAGYCNDDRPGSSGYMSARRKASPDASKQGNDDAEAECESHA